MPILDTQRQRAAWLILALGLALLWALWPFSTGLIGAPVLYVVFAPVQRELTRYLRPGLAAAVVVVIAIVLVVAPLASIIGLVANEAQDMATSVIRSPLLARLREVRTACGRSSRSPPRAPRSCATVFATSRSRPSSARGSRRWCRGCSSAWASG